MYVPIEFIHWHLLDTPDIMSAAKNTCEVLNYFHHIYLLMCAEGRMCHSICVEVRGQRWGAILSFHHVGSGAQGLGIMLGSKSLYLLNCLPGSHHRHLCDELLISPENTDISISFVMTQSCL